MKRTHTLPSPITSILTALLCGAVLAVMAPRAEAAASTPSERSADEVVPLKDWLQWDSLIDRRYLPSLPKVSVLMPEDPWLDYVKAFTFEAPADSIGLPEFRTRTAAQRQARRELAQGYLDKAARFEMVLWDFAQKFRADPRGNWMELRPKGLFESTTICIDNLVKATGVDPSNPVAWYDLALMTGVVGDWKRQLRCLDAAAAAIGDDPDGRYRLLGRRIALDRAWHHRDRGRLAEALSLVDSADALGAPDQEAVLLRGLVLADMGEFAEACRLGADLHSIRIHKADYGYGFTDFAERWIQSMAYKAIGEMPLACFALGRINRKYKIPFASKYYNDIGMMCELNGQTRDALEYYRLAAMYNPLLLYYPFSFRGGYTEIHGQSGAELGCTITYDRHYIAGSLFAYGARMLLSVESAENPEQRSELAEIAVDAFDACRRRRIYPTSALALRGRVHYYCDDHERAAADLNLACDEMAEQGRGDSESFLLAGLLNIELEDYDRAVVQLRRTLQLDPTNPHAWRAVSVAMIGAGTRDAGRRAIDQAVTIDPASAIAWYNRGLLNFQEQRWGDACVDLQQAVQLAPGDERISELLARAEMLRGSSPVPRQRRPDSADDSADDTSTSDPDLALWREKVPQSFFHAPPGDEPGVTGLYEKDLSETLGRSEAGLTASWVTLSDADLQTVVANLERSYRNEPTRTVRRELAMAYVRTGQVRKGRALLLPFWEQDIKPAEMCVVLEADRALGEVSRARRLARSLGDDRPDIQDPMFWSLVAFICLDSGWNEDGLLALEAAIACDPGNIALRSQRQLLNAGDG